MGTPEDVVAEIYFTPPDRRTLTDMLRENMYYDSEDDAAIEEIKTTFKSWLKEVAIGKETPDTIRIRKDFIMLIDEP